MVFNEKKIFRKIKLESALRLVAESQCLIEVRLEIGCPYIIDRA